MFEDVIACDLGPLTQKSWLACDGTVHLSPHPDGTIVILSDYADMLWRCECQYALGPQCPVVMVRTFLI